MTEIPDALLFIIFDSVVVGAFAWAWRLSIKVAKLETKQESKADSLASLENKVDRLCDDVSEIKGTLREHLK